MKNGSAFKGLGVAMVTPFNESGQIDFKGLGRVTEHLIQGGVDYLVVQGTTGESPTLSKAEKYAVLEFILETNRDRKPVVFGVGGNNTTAVCEELESLNTKGLSGILSVSPAYNKPGDEGLFQHYRHIDQSTDLPIILYNVPSRTASNVKAEVTLRCAEELKNIVALKEASGDLNQIKQIIEKAPTGFAVLSGDDILALPIIKMGGQGVISVIGNALPRIYGQLVTAAMQGELDSAQESHERLLPVMGRIFKEGNPAGIKEVLKHLGICSAHVRLPLTKVSSSLSKELYSDISELELLAEGA